MDQDRRTARVVGVLFIMATVASILGSVALGSVLEGPNYLTKVAAHDGRVVLAALLFLIALVSAFATAFVLFPILRRHAEGFAAGYVGFRVFENVFYAAYVLALLTMLTVSQSDAVPRAAATDVPLVGVTLLAMNNWSGLLGTLIFFGLGSTVLNYVLYRSRLVPRWLSTWGIIGALLAVLYGTLGIFGLDTSLSSPSTLLALPIAVQEMVFAVWLIAKGFDRPAGSANRRPRGAAPLVLPW
jgi:hypothetical protein